MSAGSFDLLTRAWVPVRRGGARTMVGLRELFARAHELSDVEAVLPPGAAGLWRVLAVIAARITGLDDMQLSPEAWYERRNELLARGRFDPDATLSYFERYAERFDLFHPERPWLQDPRLAAQCPSPSGVNRLVWSRPAGNNQIWFAHHTDLDPYPVPTAEAVWHLLAWLYYGPSGRCTTRKVGATSMADTKAGPLRGVVSYHPVGRTVFESLLAGIPYLPPQDGGAREGAAPWEAGELPDPLGVPARPQGIGGVLTGRFQHALLLQPGEGGATVVNAWVTWGRRDKCPPVADPYLIYQHDQQGSPSPRLAKVERALWRDLDALLLEDVGDAHSRRPKILKDAAELPAEVLEALRVRAYGFDQDGKTRDRQWFTATTPPVLTLLRHPDAASTVSHVRQAAERVAQRLQWALREAWTAISERSDEGGPATRKPSGARNPWVGQGAARYWPAAERVFWAHVHGLLAGQDRGDPTGQFIQVALRAYDEVTDHAVRPRARGAVERARPRILTATR